MAFNAKELLKYALEKLSADEVAALLEKSDIVFGIQGTYGKFEGGNLKTEQGGTIQGGIGAVTGVKTVESFREEQSRRSGLPKEQRDAAERQERIDQQLRAGSDPKLATTSTLLNGGVAPVTASPVKGQPGVRVVGGNVSGNDHGRQENIASGGLATAGHSTVNENRDTIPAGEGLDKLGQGTPSSETVQTPENQNRDVNDENQAQGQEPKGVSADEAKRLAEEARKK